MLVNTQVKSEKFRHNYVRLALLIGTLLLFLGHIAVQQLADWGNNFLFPNQTSRSDNVTTNDITPSDWIYRSLDAFNYLWQLSWLLYSLTFIFRRSATGYLYLSPRTLTPTFFVFYNLGFLVETIWLLLVHRNNEIWTWAVHLISFLLLTIALFIISNNLSVNRKLYETDGLNRDIWCLRFFSQNGVAFFSCWIAVRLVLSLDSFLQLDLSLSSTNAGSIVLILAGLIGTIYFFGPNLHAAVNEKCSYLFSPWFVFIIFFWGVVENNWLSSRPTRNNILAAIELIGCIVSAIFALILFTIRNRTSKLESTG